jgi:PhnB protein
MTVHPYLNFPGTTEAAFDFYKSVFGGEYAMVQRFGDGPGGEKVPESVKNKIMHIALPLKPDCILMGTDALPEMGFKLIEGNNFRIMLGVDSREEADKFFSALVAGGKADQPMSDMFWGAYYGELSDKFGIKWMINHHPQPPHVKP